MDMEKLNLGATVFNVLLTLGILVAAVIGLHRTANQIEAATLYQIAADGRTLMREERGHGEPATHVDVLSYFHSVFLLHQNGVIRDEAWSPIRRAFCFFIKEDNEAQAYLSEHSTRYEDSYVTLADSYKEGKECV